ncbi:hypothetical protein SeMB42_g01694 [Synchytrium endobioticum]|uniref:DUF300-domain-containing protein n=1 Tax=Synchytrium endobioticum TaxID=286115 RepID=A0A507D308_9FUNG|nr:hypothetical protein SeLEV6574_g03762 [Synchytrium endobioticum]TPX52026.1 hypothetical protein SeMB42_g01694 [Synchytrium endobioticum]
MAVSLLEFEEGSEKLGALPYVLAGLGAFSGTAIALWSMWMHLKNYRRPDLQRAILRIIWMVPIYGIASFVSLSSRNLSDYIDTVRDVYEAFVIWTFFMLLVNYLGGERAIMSMMESRMRTHHMWPFNYCFGPLDVSDPQTFLLIRRGVLQFVLVKPTLAVFILLLKMSDSYNEGYISWSSSYMWTSILYNISVCVAMYFLIMFYVMCARDLAPFRPFPKFLCVKAIIFFSFWQGLTISFLIALGAIRGKGVYDASNIAVALQDFLICLECVPFAIGHWYAFTWKDYTSSRLSSRLPLKYAFKDALGMRDIVLDWHHTVRGTTFRSRPRFSRSHLFERELEDGEREFVLGGDQRMFYDPETFAGSRLYTESIYGDLDDEDETTSLDFPDIEADAELEATYEKARDLLYGDYNYPPLPEEGFRNPPVIQSRIDATSYRISQIFDGYQAEAALEQSQWDILRGHVGLSGNSKSNQSHSNISRSPLKKLVDPFAVIHHEGMQHVRQEYLHQKERDVAYDG